MILGIFLFMVTSLQTSLQEYSLTIEGLSCFAYSYSDMNDKKPLLVLVHGSPGDYTGWDKYLKDKELSSKYRILALDRPGFGKSVKANVLAYPNLEFQGKVLRAFVRKYGHGQKVTLVGHSVGAPIVSLVAAKYPNQITNLVLLAPAISAKNEQPRFYNRLAQKKWINKKIPF